MEKNNLPVLVSSLIGLALIVGLGWVLISSFGSTPPLVGGDRDEHGCIGSAGYTWCETRKECIRTWETYCTAAEQKKVVFACEGGKAIVATFYVNDDKFVDLELNDERKISLPRAISASGARYARADESIVFWNKGDTAFITEGDPNTLTFDNCVLK